MHDLDQNEDRLRGTYGFPLEFITLTAVIHATLCPITGCWNMKSCVFLRELSLSTLDEKSFTAKAGDIIFVHSGILHSGIPKFVYECIVFDMNAFLKAGSVCSGYIQRIVHQDIMIYHHFTTKQKEIIESANRVFFRLS